MKLCMGLCQGKVTQNEYAEIIAQAKNYIHNGGDLTEELTRKMEECS